MPRNILLNPDPAQGGGANPEPTTSAPTPAPVPVAVAPDPATPDPAPPNVQPEPDPLLAALYSDMKDGPEDLEIKAVPDPDPIAADPAPASDPVLRATPDDPKPAPKPRKPALKLVVNSDVLDDPAPTPVPVTIAQSAPAPAPEPPDPDVEYVAGLTDEQKDRLDEAGVAGRLFPEKYGQHRKKLLAWYRSLDSTISTLSAADPGRSLDENDEEFKRFLQTKPKLDAPARDRVQRAIGAEEAERRVMEKMTPQLDALSMKQKEIELKPKVDALVRQVGDGVLNLLAGDAKSSMSEAAKAYKDKGDSGLGDLPLEAEVMRSEVEILSTLVTEYSHIAKGVRAFDGGNPYHAGLLKFINEEGDTFAKRGGAMRERGGKSFLPRADYLSLERTNPAGASKHWTFTHDDVIRMLVYKSKERMESRVKTEETLASKRGFTRKPKADSSKSQKVEPQPLNPPVAVPIPARGGAQSPEAVKPASGEIDVVDTLGFKKF